jgi:hypothetical protein
MKHVQLYSTLSSVQVQVCTVFAQLTVNGKWEGPHVFVVRIRNDDGGPIPGVRIEDNGAKVCLPLSASSVVIVAVASVDDPYAVLHAPVNFLLATTRLGCYVAQLSR